jgi:hypothetical protein
MTANFSEALPAFSTRIFIYGCFEWRQTIRLIGQSHVPYRGDFATTPQVILLSCRLVLSDYHPLVHEGQDLFHRQACSTGLEQRVGFRQHRHVLGHDIQAKIAFCNDNVSKIVKFAMLFAVWIEVLASRPGLKFLVWANPQSCGGKQMPDDVDAILTGLRLERERTPKPERSSPTQPAVGERSAIFKFSQSSER